MKEIMMNMQNSNHIYLTSNFEDSDVLCHYNSTTSTFHKID